MTRKASTAGPNNGGRFRQALAAASGTRSGASWFLPERAQAILNDAAVLLLSLSYHAQARPVLRLFQLERGRQISLATLRFGARRDDDLLGFVGHLFDD